MHDRQVIRRRRAVLGLLVVASIVLLTASFGDGGGSGAGALQRGVGEVVSPIQEGASRALKPARDLVGWVGDTFDAKGELKDLRAERDRLVRRAADAENAIRENKQLKGLMGLNEDLTLEDYDPVAARVITQSPTLWYVTIKINKGASDGLRAGMPVVASDGEGTGLVGRITTALNGSAVVTLITDSSTGISARVAGGSAAGVVEPKVGDPRDLVLRYTRRTDPIERRDLVVTAGTTNPRVPSLFPSGIPIGRVTRIEEPNTDAQLVHLQPDVDLRSLEFVQVLTKNLQRGT